MSPARGWPGPSRLRAAAGLPGRGRGRL